MASEMTCPGCGKRVPAAEGQHNHSGDLVCRACLAKSQIAHQADVVEETRRDAKHGDIIYVSIGALALSLAGQVIAHRLVFLLAPLAAVVGAVLSIVIPAAYREVRQALGWKLLPHLIMATVALAISGPDLLAAYHASDAPQEQAPAQQPVRSRTRPKHR